MGDRRARLIDDGWDSHDLCGGTGWYYADRPCLECFEGLLPPDGMVKAAGRATAIATFGSGQKLLASKNREWWDTVYQQATVTLVEAERWAAKQ